MEAQLSWSTVPDQRRTIVVSHTPSVDRIRPATRVRPGEVFHCPDNGDVAVIQSGTLIVELMMTGGSTLSLVRYTAGDVAPVLNQLSTPAFTLGYRAADLAQMNWLPSDQIAIETRERIARAHAGLLRAAMCQIACLACLPAAHRLYVELLRCAQMMGYEHFVMPTHGELASRVCTTRETISRELSILRREGVLSSGRNVRLLAPDDLVRRIARTLNLDRDSDVWESVGIVPANAF